MAGVTEAASGASPPIASPPPRWGEIAIGEPFEIPNEPLPAGLPPDTFEYPAGRQAASKLLARHYEARGFIALPGADFEENLLRAVHEGVERKTWDDYARIKLGRAPFSDRARRYADTVRAWVGPADVEFLLALCRLCTYAGGPGFPDLLLLPTDARPPVRPHLRFLAAPRENLPREQALFALLGALSGFEVRAAGPEAPLRILPRDLLAGILQDERARAMTEGLERALRAEREALGRAGPAEAGRIRDEVEALEVERSRNPLGLLRRWLDQGAVRCGDVPRHARVAEASHRAALRRFEAIETELQREPGFAPRTGGSPWRENMTPDALARLMEILQSRFHLGETRVKAFLAYLKDA